MLLAPGNPSLARSDIGFFSKYAALLDILLRVGDLAIVALTGLAIYALRSNIFAVGESCRSGTIVAVLLALLILPVSNIYRSRRGELNKTNLWRSYAGIMCDLRGTWSVKSVIREN